MYRIFFTLLTLFAASNFVNADEHHRHDRHHEGTFGNLNHFKQNQKFDQNRYYGHGHHHDHDGHRHGRPSNFNDLRGFYGVQPHRYVQPGPRYFPNNRAPQSPYGIFLGSGGPVLMYHGPNVSIIIR